MRARFTLLLSVSILLSFTALAPTQTGGGGVLYLRTQVLPLGGAVLEPDTIVAVTPSSRYEGALASRPTAIEYAELRAPDGVLRQKVNLLK